MAENTEGPNAFTEATGVELIIPIITLVAEADRVTLSPEQRAELVEAFAKVNIPTIRFDMADTDAKELYHQPE